MSNGVMEFVISKNGAIFRIKDQKFAVLEKITGKSPNFIVPAEIMSIGQRYKVILFKGKSNQIYEAPIVDTILFDDSSEVEAIPLSFILRSKAKFFLPRSIKRVTVDQTIRLKGPSIIYDKDNRYVSIINKRNIINHHPLEILYRFFYKSTLFVRETVRIIGNYSFLLTGLRSVVIPASVYEIANSAFSCCYNLQSILFKGKSSLKTIGKSAFNECKLKSIIFPSSLETIGKYSFKRCQQLCSISFTKDSKLKKIGNSAFIFTLIASIDFPSSVEEIGDSAFGHCYFLKSIKFSEESKLRKIGDSAFIFDERIESLEFPASLEEIGRSAFESNPVSSLLSSVTFPKDSNLKIIGNSAFHRAKLQTIEFPASLEEIGESAFSYSSSIRSIKFPPESKLRKICSHAFKNDKRITSVEFPASLEEIGESAFGCFKRNSMLSSITFPKNSNLKKIGKTAFHEANITSIEFPSSLEEIGEFAFGKCYYLTSVKFPDDSKLKNKCIYITYERKIEPNKDTP